MNDLEALFESAVEHHQAGSLVVAKALYKQILRKNPRHIGVLNNLGAALDGLGLFDEAIDAYRAALKIEPNNASLHNNLGNVLKELGSLDAAVEHYEASLALDPSNSEAHNNLGAVLQGLGRFDEAISCFRKSLAIRDDSVEALNNLGDTLHVVDRLEEAGDCFRRAFELAPSDGLRIKLALLLSPFHASSDALDRSRRTIVAEIDALCAKPAVLVDPLHEVNAAPFYLGFQGYNDRELMGRIGELFRDALPEYATPNLPLPPGERLRVGFISSFWSSQSAGSRYEDAIVRIADTDEFEITIFAAGPAASREELFDGAELNIVRLPMNLGAARQMVANRCLDILIYADIGIDPFTYYLSFTRLAEIQCVLGGHPVTTGVPTVDYFLSSTDLDTADGQERYSETLIRLDCPPGSFRRPALPETPASRAELGLPTDRTLYVCPVMPFKLHPSFDAMLAGILRRDENGEIVLFQDRPSPALHEKLVERFRHSMPDVASRIRFLPFAPRPVFMNILMAADVLLDSHPFGAVKTAFIALAAGTPLVTLPGADQRGRVVYSCYRRMGLDDCIARDADDYVDIAIRLGADPEWCDQVGRAILERNHLLYDDNAGAEALSAFFRELLPAARKIG